MEKLREERMIEKVGPTPLTAPRPHLPTHPQSIGCAIPRLHQTNNAQRTHRHTAGAAGASVLSQTPLQKGSGVPHFGSGARAPPSSGAMHPRAGHTNVVELEDGPHTCGKGWRLVTQVRAYGTPPLEPTAPRKRMQRKRAQSCVAVWAR